MGRSRLGQKEDSGQEVRGAALIFPDVKVHVQTTNRYYYPDVMVTCDERD
ncbi:hypothetical protein [Pseudanabaena sp. FACHB-2040]|nr:hypothetical protein [Pseudanabaena sp. FACHB-2040]MBD2259729.1 hypothetical protein [Pseudanabaena sp. FACHB-2040]